MAICPEFLHFEQERGNKEDAFIQRFLVPLLTRLGYGIIVNYHGRREYGRDLIFGELDRFSHVRYYGLQAKYEPSIGLAKAHDLVRDCEEAFTVDFTHPHTGGKGKISSFYAVNAGNISQEAEDYFFAALRLKYADNVRLIDGKGLLLLDRCVAIARVESHGDILNGLLCELRFNLQVASHVFPQLKAIAAGDGNNVQYPPYRMRLNAMSSYLVRPIATADIPLATMERCWSMGTIFNSLLDAPDISPLQTVVSIKIPAQKLMSVEPQLTSDLQVLHAAGLAVMAKLGPLVAI